MSAGFENAPLMRAVSLIVLLMSTVLRSSSISFDLYRLFNGEWWRIFTSFFVFENSAQLIVGLILMYSCRQFERQMGTRKFAAFLIFTMMSSTLLSIAFMVVAASVGLHLSPSSGPFSLIYALMAYYYWYIPKLHPSQYAICGMGLSEKSWIYLLGVQLCISDGIPSIAAALPGITAGYLYETDGYGIQSWRLPSAVEYVFSALGRFVNVFFPATPRDQVQVPAGRQPRQPNPAQRHAARSATGTGTAGGTNAAIPAAAPPPPSEEAINALMGMGFDREAVVQALRSSGNNLEAAANVLLR